MLSIYKLPVIVRHALILVISLLFQLLFFSTLEISVYMTVSFYIFFILTLPVKIKKFYLISISFLYGLLLDTTMDGGGLYAMTTTALAFVRPSVLRLFFVRDERYRNSLPSSKEMGIGSFLVYSFIMILIGNLVFVGVESVGFISVFIILLKSVVAALVSLPFIYLTQLILLQNNSSSVHNGY